MGYFSCGAECADYEARYCERRVHRDGPNGLGCPVWEAHLLKNYDDCDNDDSILHLLIPRSDDGLSNKQCRLFIPQSGAER